jgi:uncharacterized membrane protein YraQ (UPF0718 family)
MSWEAYGEAAKTAAGFFWKAGWAFVLGYGVSAMIQAFVPKKRLTHLMGDPGPKSVSLATVFGTISSSCSFAALATARALVRKGAHFVAAVAFMFASTNLVIELGVLIFIFLGWQFLVAEVIGGLLLIAISSVIIRLTLPRKLVEQARRRLEGDDDEDDFDWRKRIRSREGWELVGQRFVADWKMVWREIVVGFTVAGFVAVLVPASFWEAIFPASGAAAGDATFGEVLVSAMVAPFVAAATFIGSMGNIPLATVLNAGGVAFAGVMGFIYSDLMVPPLVKVNARYYGWKLALYIAAVMYVSIVATALVLDYGFELAGAIPESGRRIGDVAQFKVDYTFYMNVGAVLVAGIMVALARARRRRQNGHGGHDHGGSGIDLQTLIAWTCLAVVAVGLVAHLVA